MKKVIVLQPVLAHYRRTLFNILAANKNYEVRFVSGKIYENIESFSINNASIFNYLKFSFGSHTFYYLRKAVSFICKENPDIIISSGIDPHLIHTILIFFIQKIFRRKKFYWWSHASLSNQGMIGTAFRMFFYRRSDGILTYNQKGRDNLIYHGLKSEKIKVLGNSLNQEDYGFINHKLGLKKQKIEVPNIIFSGRINRSRRLDVLIKAISLIRKQTGMKINCTIIGGGSVNKILKLIDELDLTNQFIFTGPKYGADTSEYFLAADLMVYPKAIGLSILHAYSYGIPVITSNNLKVQMPEIELMAPGETGDLYKEDDYEDLAKQILKWSNKIYESKDDIRKKCINRIRKLEYLPEIMAEKMLNFLDNT